MLNEIDESISKDIVSYESSNLEHQKLSSATARKPITETLASARKINAAALASPR